MVKIHILKAACYGLSDQILENVKIRVVVVLNSLRFQVKSL